MLALMWDVSPPSPRAEAEPECGQAPARGVAQVGDVVRERYPGARIAMMTLPPGGDAPSRPIQVWIQEPGDIHRRVGDTRAWIDPFCPVIRSSLDGADLSPGHRLKQWFPMIHSDLGLGLVGQASIFAAGMALPVLYGTDLLIWLRKRRLRRDDTRGVPLRPVSIDGLGQP